jgi:hypothetical protein
MVPKQKTGVAGVKARATRAIPEKMRATIGMTKEGTTRKVG